MNMHQSVLENSLNMHEFFPADADALVGPQPLALLLLFEHTVSSPHLIPALI